MGAEDPVTEVVHSPGIRLFGQGGGIGGGAFVLGVMSQLLEFGLQEHIREVYTVSAAKPAIEHPLLGQAEETIDTWINEVATEDVADTKRTFSSRPIFDVDHLVDEIPIHFKFTLNGAGQVLGSEVDFKLKTYYRIPFDTSSLDDGLIDLNVPKKGEKQ